MRAFIAEDSAAIRKYLIDTLRGLAHVGTGGLGETADEGLRWLEQHGQAWDLAIVDLYLRDGSGLNILAAVGRHQARQKVVVLSNHATADIRAHCAELGADAVFDKSTEIEKLVNYCCALQVTRSVWPKPSE